jgi:hypothetical protein
VTELEDHDHYTGRQKRFDSMDPNLKLLFEDLLKQVREEIKEVQEEIKSGFTVHLNSVD